MESGIKRTQRDCTLAFKLAVVDQVDKGELTYKQVQDRYGIQGRSTVLVWLRKHGRQGWGHAASSRLSMPVPMKKSSSRLQRCSRPNRRSRLSKRAANEKARLIEAVLDVLQKGYGLRVVKKPAARAITPRALWHGG